MARINSHIQLPRLILANFVDEKCKVPYLDLRDGKIGFRGPRKLGTIFGYFNEENEKFLGSQIEDPFGKVRNEFQKFEAKKYDELKITFEFEDIIKNFVSFSILRSEIAKESVLKYSKTIFNDDPIQDILIEYGRNFDTMKRCLENYRANLLINNTMLGFAVPRNCWYHVPHSDTPSIIMPISPSSAIILMHPSDIDKYLVDGHLFYGQVKSEGEVQRFNEYALQFEYIQNRAFVASRDKDELSRLQEVLHKNQGLYDEIRKSII